MTFFGNFPTLGWLAEPKSCVAVAPESGLKPDADAELEGFRKTAPRCRAAPSETYLVGTDPGFKASSYLFSKMSAAWAPEGAGRRRRGLI
jgi:hypothetical protein